MRATLLTTPRATANKWLHDNFGHHIAKDIIKIAYKTFFDGHATIGEDVDQATKLECITEWREENPDIVVIDRGLSTHVSERMTNAEIQDAALTYVYVHDVAKAEIERRHSMPYWRDLTNGRLNSVPERSLQ